MIQDLPLISLFYLKQRSFSEKIVGRKKAAMGIETPAMH
jgi:hypothetical protein